MAIDNITGNESVEELQQLYALFENRMRILDQKKTYTKPEIYQKVRAEYEAKLFELQVLLEEKGAGMQEALDAAIAERDQLVARTHQIKDQLDEMELRAVIGEIDENTFAARQQEMQNESAAIDGQLLELSARIENYQRLVGGQAQPAVEPVVEIPLAAEPEPQPEPQPAVLPPQPVAQPAAPPRPVPQPMMPPRAAAPAPVATARPAPALQPAPAAQRPVPPAAATAVRPAAPAPVAEPQPGASARPAPAPVSTPRPAPMHQAAQQPAAPVAAAAADHTAPTSPEMDALEKQFASILSSTMADSAALEKPAMEEVFTPQMPDVVEQPAMPLPEALAHEPAPEEAAGEENHEGELKCPKCGAFNRADNWYCEKCGNELLNAADLLGGSK
jgi:hypothetical protein